MRLYFQQQLRNGHARPREKLGRQFPATLRRRSRIRRCQWQTQTHTQRLYRCLGLGQMITPPSSTTTTTTGVTRGANGRAWSTTLWPSLGRTRSSMLSGTSSDSEWKGFFFRVVSRLYIQMFVRVVSSVPRFLLSYSTIDKTIQLYFRNDDMAGSVRRHSPT
jgi:hypothetical protein